MSKPITSFVIIIIIIYLLVAGCSSASMSSTSPQKSPAIRPSPTPTFTPATPSPMPQTIMPIPQPTILPSEVVGGQEVINNCAQCLFRASQLSATLGFSAEMSRAKNEGFYKISPARNLCDIHFLANFNTTIRDHDGQSSSILGDQIAIYCPCNCGWASEY